MFAKLKKKIAEETAVAQRPGGTTRIPRSVSKESVASMGADSGDDFVSVFSFFECLIESVYVS
jgi:golgin subfamily A protein 1